MSIAQPRRIEVGPLAAIEFPAPDAAPVVFCMHGYGANMADLAPLAMELALEKPMRWVFPDAPIAMDPGGGRAWFPIDPERLMNLQMGGDPIDLSGSRPGGLDAAIETVGKALEDLAVPWDKLILGGFSQGAMLALETALRAPSSPRGMFLLSGNLVDRGSVEPLVKARRGLRFFQSHGRQDPILAWSGAAALEKLLKGAGLEGELFSFDGVHELPVAAMGRFRDFLGSLS